MNTKKFEKLVYKYLDGTLSNKENEAFKYELDNSLVHKDTYNQIIKMRSAVSAAADDSFSPSFENRVLENISVESFTGINTRINNFTDSLGHYFRRIALTAAVMLALLVTYNLTNGNNYSIENLLGISKTNYEYAFDPLNNLIGSGK